MTVIAAAVIGNTMAIAGDRGASKDGTIVGLAKPKIAKRGQYLIGYYGSMEGDRLLELFNVPPIPDAVTDLDNFMFTVFNKELYKFYEEQHFNTDDEDSGLGLIVMARGMIYDHDITDGSMHRYDKNYYAVGSGEAFALGALSAVEWKSAEAAATAGVRAAVEFSTTCRGPIDVVTRSIGERKKKSATKPTTHRPLD